MPDGGDAEVVEIDIRIDAAAWRDGAGPAAGCVAAVEAAVRAALADADDADGRFEISILLTDDAAVAELNSRWRGKDGPTNVLSFPGDDADRAAADGRPAMLGDVIVAFETLAREAAAAGIPFADHLRHIIVHGVLHLLGYDHEGDADAEEMEGREIEILATLGVPDPYDSSDPVREQVN